MTNSRSIQRLEDDSRRRWPGITIYDVGDEEHSRGTSGHNHDDVTLPLGGRAEEQDADSKPEVRALDWMIRGPFTKADAAWLFEALTRRPANQKRLLYVIYNRRIRRRATGWVDEPYYGSNPHTDHVHGSGRAADDENAAAWDIWPTPPPKPEPKGALMTVMFQVKNTAPVYTGDGGHVPSGKVRDALLAKGVPLILLDTQAEMNAILPGVPVLPPVTVDLDGLADRVVARLPETTLTQDDVRAAVVDVLVNGVGSEPAQE